MDLSSVNSNVFSSLTSSWTRIFFSMCRKPSCSYQDPRSHHYKIKSRQRVFYRVAQYAHADYSNDKWMSSLCLTCTSILRRSCSKGRSRCLRPLGLLLVNAEQSNNHPLPFGWQHKDPKFFTWTESTTFGAVGGDPRLVARVLCQISAVVPDVVARFLK